MSAGRPVLLVVAKAPVPGRVKTRLTPPYTPHQAASLAAAALLDTLDACRAAARAAGAEVVVALDGELSDAVLEEPVRGALSRVRVVRQRGRGLGERLAAAHLDAAGPFGATVQLGMDTPQVDAAVLARALLEVTAADGPDAVLGPAEDGGWWVLGLRRAADARCLRGVPMSSARTGEETLRALGSGHRRVDLLPALRDVDTADDVRAVAALASGRFGELAGALGVPAGARR